MKSWQFLPARPVTIRPYVLIKEVAGIQGGAGAASHAARGEVLGHDSPLEAGCSAGCGQGVARCILRQLTPGVWQYETTQLRMLKGRGKHLLAGSGCRTFSLLPLKVRA